MSKYPRYLPCGDSAVMVEFGEVIDPGINARLCSLAAAIADSDLPVTDAAPAYASLLVCYDPLRISRRELVRALKKLDMGAGKASTGSVLHKIPVYYGGENGPDMENVCRHTGLTPEEVVRLHSAPEYTVFMVGFLPGFPYLGGMDARLETPRLETPRTKIPAGSVGIGGKQTGIYPMPSPGGWQLIGRTDAVLFDAERQPPALLKAGDRIKFVPAR